MKQDKLVAIRISTDLEQRIKQQAENEGRNFSNMIKRMAECYIAEQEEYRNLQREPVKNRR